MILVFILFFLFLLLSWMILDFNFGRKKHLQQVTERHYPLRYSQWNFCGDGKQLYLQLFQDIRSATDHIHILFFIIRNDRISHEFLTLIKKKAKEGVTVRLLLDRVGSHKLPKKEVNNLKKSGVRFSYSHHPRFPFLFYSFHYRNHRKITVIDGNIGYFGGFNIGKEYIGQDPKLGFWRDYHLKLSGDGVQDLQTEFLRDWLHATGENLLTNQKCFPTLSKGNTPLTFVPTDGAFMKKLVISLIQKAEKELMIGSPYFIPGKDIQKEIISAAKRGVNVTMIVPIKKDHPFVKEASFPYFKALLQSGCHIYQYHHGFYHGKVIIVDEKICDIGTANFDKRSFFINDELNCLIEERAFIQKMKTEFIKDLHHSQQLTWETYKKRSIFHRVKEGVSTLISELL